MKSAVLSFLALGFLFFSCVEAPVVELDPRSARIEQLAAELEEGNPWPEVREERINKLLPQAMDAADVDVWVVLCRENNNDPIANHIGGEDAGPLTVFLFQRTESGVDRVIVAAQRLVIPYQERFPDAQMLGNEQSEDPLEILAEELRRRDPKKIAVNKSALAAADGLSATQYETLKAALGPALAGRLTSSGELVVRWLGVKLPAEHEIMRTAAELTDLLELEAFDHVVPGKTTNEDMHLDIRARVEGLGFGHSWVDQPGITTGLDGGSGNVKSKVIQPGDLINIDAGIKVYDTWCTDIQRFAYCLKEGETEPPEHIQRAWEAAVESNRKMNAAMVPGKKGWEIDKVQIEWQKSQGSLRHWAGAGHPVGYWAHDLGPGLREYYPDKPPTSPRAFRELEVGMVFAYDGVYVWPATYDGVEGTISITVEEMSRVTENGGEYLSPVQDDLVLIPYPEQP
jgi:Xaa-Pro aminopeptidase